MLYVRHGKGVEGPGIQRAHGQAKRLQLELCCSHAPQPNNGGLPLTPLISRRADPSQAAPVVHHVQDAHVLVVQVLRVHSLLRARLQLHDGGQLSDNLLQQTHLVLRASVILIAVVLELLGDVGPHGGGHGAHGAQHPLERLDRELRDHRGEGQAAGQHEQHDEHGGKDGEQRARPLWVVHVESDLERLRAHQQRGGLPGRARSHPRRRSHVLPAGELLLAHEAEDVFGGVPAAGLVGPVPAVAEEPGHLLQVPHGLLRVASLEAGGSSVHPGLQGEVCLGEGQEIEEGHGQHQRQRQDRHPRGQQVGQLPRDVASQAPAVAARLLAAAEAEDAQHPREPRQPPGAGAHARGPRGAHEHLRRAGRVVVRDVWQRRVLPSQEGYVQDNGRGADHVHPEEDAGKVVRIDQCPQGYFDRKKR
mmetsp:Transcript_91688/g.245938  ORF Transcript_91688/g.245938 Transcript_91688/m.245938 type:complete len:419 (-) Transcript_91688:256-1512(-)